MSLGRVERLLAALGAPQDAIGPTIHVAGTNGKGSTIAYLRAMAQAAGLRVNAYTSPHLVRFNERIRIADETITDAELADLLAEVERVNAGAPITFFEITTVAAFLAFARRPADLTLLEVGMGGRLDATNVIRTPVCSVITPVSFDHMDYLGETLDAIAGEKAGILKSGVPAVIAQQPPEAAAAIAARAIATGAPLFRAGQEWHGTAREDHLSYRGVRSRILPLPVLPGPHQTVNAATAVAAAEMLPGRLRLDETAIAAGLARAQWPARLQRLTRGPLVDMLPVDCTLWLDGGHNEDGARAIAAWAATLGDRTPLDIVLALRSTKRAEPVLEALRPALYRLVCVGNPADPVASPPSLLAEAARRIGIAPVFEAPDVAAGLRLLDAPRRVLVCGSLYLAGAVLADNG
jgi:dihydrofolate synthase/folylpolyglutamate synthase